MILKSIIQLLKMKIVGIDIKSFLARTIIRYIQNLIQIS
jgi:hypothetical protein